MKKRAPKAAICEQQAHSGGCLCDSDLAVERRAADPSCTGISEEKRRRGAVTIHEIRVVTDEAAAAIGKPRGTYITLFHAPAWELWGEAKEEVARALSREMLRLAAVFYPSIPPHRLTVLFVGLGNRNLTADAIGPRAAAQVTATLHLRTTEPALFERLRCAGVAVCAPGVTAETGVEAADTVLDLSRRIRPDLVVAVDALAARSTERLATTIQLCDTGVAPGSGLGMKHIALTRETLGAPVIAVGVPTVVRSRTLVADALTEAGRGALCDPILAHMGQSDFFVSPKDIDTTADTLSSIIAMAFERLFGP